jgi:hypothetical protein
VLTVCVAWRRADFCAGRGRIYGETQEARLVGNQRTHIMKILIASTPATGHINPLLAITRVLLAEGHEITFLTGGAFRDRIENGGAKFVSLHGHADFDGRDFSSVAPELKDIPPGLEWFRVAIERIFVDSIPAQHLGLLQALEECQADVIVGDDMFFGVLPMLLGPRSKRPPLILCGTSFLHLAREDGAPNFLACCLRRQGSSVVNTRVSHGRTMRPSISRPFLL